MLGESESAITVELLVRNRRVAAARPRSENGGDAGLPVDQGAVAVEAEGVERCEVHRHMLRDGRAAAS